MFGHHSSKVLSGIAMVLFLIAPSTAATGHLSIPAAAFQPENNSSVFNYGNYGGGLACITGCALTFNAPLQLPDHAHITGMTYYWNDSSQGDASVDFVQSNLDPTGNVVSTVYSNGATGIASSSTVTMTLTVDNSIHDYYLTLHPGDGSYTIWSNAVVIDYTYPILLPMINR
jgi:hypothetical protein